MRTRPIAILVVLLMIGWPFTIVGAAGAAPTENPALSGNTLEANFIEEGDNQFTNVSDDLIVWERSFLPLRADTTADSAKTVIENHDLSFKDNRSGVPEETLANRPETAIFEKETIPVEFRSGTGANTDSFGDRDAQVIVASFGENKDTADVASADQLNDVVSPAFDGDLSKLRTEAANRDVTFTVEDKQLEDGELTYNLDPDTAGPYVVMVALPRDGNGFDTDNGLLTLPGSATLMGVETVMVQDSASEIDTPNRVEPGDNINLDLSTDLTGDVTHSVVVYDEDTFVDDDEKTAARLDEDISSSLTTDDIVLEHSIASVNGVGEMTDSGTLFGTSVSQRTVTGTVALADIIDQLSDETNVNINRETTGSTELDASGVVKPNIGTDTEMTIQTYGNWSEGTYRIIHVAENGTVEGIATSTNTLEIKESTSSGGSSSSGGDDDDDGDDVEDVTPPSDGQPNVTVTEREGGASVSVQNIQANTPTRISVGRNVTSNGATIRNFTVDLVQNRSELNLEVDTSDQPPESIPGPDTGEALSYIDIDADDLTDDDYNSVEWDFTVDQDRLDDLDRSPESVQLTRYNETSEEWESFETSHEGGDEFTATAPGFSTFAITTAAVDDGTEDMDDDDGDGPGGTDDTDDTDSTDGDDSDGTDGTDEDDSPVGIIVLLIVLAVVIAVGVGLYQSRQE